MMTLGQNKSESTTVSFKFNQISITKFSNICITVISFT